MPAATPTFKLSTDPLNLFSKKCGIATKRWHTFFTFVRRPLPSFPKTRMVGLLLTEGTLLTDCVLSVSTAAPTIFQPF